MTISTRQHRELCLPKLQVYLFNNCVKENTWKSWQHVPKIDKPLYITKEENHSNTINNQQANVRFIQFDKSCHNCCVIWPVFCSSVFKGDLVTFYLFLATIAAWLLGWQCLSVLRFGPNWNNSTTFGWITEIWCRHSCSPWIVITGETSTFHTICFDLWPHTCNPDTDIPISFSCTWCLVFIRKC